MFFCVWLGVFCRFLPFLLGSLFENFSGANFCFWALVLVLGFLVVFCLGFCFIFLAVRSRKCLEKFFWYQVCCFWVRSLFFGFFLVGVAFVFPFLAFSRDKVQVVTGHPHTHLFCLFLFSFCVPPRLFFRPFWPCVPLLGVFFGVPFWALRVFGILLELAGLELARPFRGPFLGTRGENAVRFLRDGVSWNPSVCLAFFKRSLS